MEGRAEAGATGSAPPARVRGRGDVTTSCPGTQGTVQLQKRFVSSCLCPDCPLGEKTTSSESPVHRPASLFRRPAFPAAAQSGEPQPTPAVRGASPGRRGRVRRAECRDPPGRAGEGSGRRGADSDRQTAGARGGRPWRAGSWSPSVSRGREEGAAKARRPCCAQVCVQGSENIRLKISAFLI